MTPRRIPPASCGTVITAGRQSVGRGRVRRPLTHSAHVESDGGEGHTHVAEPPTAPPPARHAHVGKWKFCKLIPEDLERFFPSGHLLKFPSDSTTFHLCLLIRCLGADQTLSGLPLPGWRTRERPSKLSGLFSLNLNPAVCKCFWSWPNRTSCF